MEIVLFITSWLVTIGGPALLLSVLAQPIIGKLKPNWDGSKTEKIYKTAQMITLGVVLLSFLFTIIFMAL